MLPRTKNAGKALIRKQYLFMKMEVFTFQIVPNPSFCELMCFFHSISSHLTAMAFTLVSPDPMKIGRFVFRFSMRNFLFSRWENCHNLP